MRSVGTLVVSVVLSLGLIQSPVPAAQAKPSPGKSMQWQQTIQSGRAATREAMKQTGASSISVAVLHKGDVIWSQGFGVINKKGDKPTGTTKYGIGSVSKMVTTLAVMQLVDAGKIQLDAPVVRYLPAFTMLSPQYRQIKVRMLLNHTAGLPGSDYANGFSFEPIAGYPEQVLEALSKSRL
jgi:CubicO group peptidase (beta-lactamase class C family)